MSRRAPRFDMADIVRRHLSELDSKGKPISPPKWKVLSAIRRCRTPAMGGHVDVCPKCEHEHRFYNSCNNRHCPKCQALAQNRWIEARARRLLPVGHFHVVFTLPSELRVLCLRHPKILYAALFRAASDTLLELGWTHLEATLGATLILHTWTRDLRFHPHVHALVSAGGLALDGSGFVPTAQGFLFHVHRMGKLFQGKMMDHLRDHQAAKELGLGEVGFNVLMAQLAKHKWVVYAKRPYREAWHALAYLGRYTNRVGIANSRLLDVTPSEVTFRTKGKATATLSPVTFLRRFLLHVLPQGFKKIRHYGLYAAAHPDGALERAQAFLADRAIPELWRQADPDATENAEGDEPRIYTAEPGNCPACGEALSRIVYPRHSLATGGTITSPRAPPAEGASR